MPVRQQLVVFKVGEEDFAVDILLTKEVVVMREITPVPETQEYVEGVMNLRGNLVPVLDFRKRLRTSSLLNNQEEQRIVIASIEGKQTGLIVDGASEVIRVNDDSIEPAPDIITEMGADYVAGIVNLSGRFITLIDLRKALNEEITCELDDVLAALGTRARTTVAPLQALEG